MHMQRTSAPEDGAPDLVVVQGGWDLGADPVGHPRVLLLLHQHLLERHRVVVVLGGEPEDRVQHGDIM